GVVRLAAQVARAGRAPRMPPLLGRLVAEAEEAVGRVCLVQERREQEAAPVPEGAIRVLELVVLVLGGRLGDHHRVAPLGRGVAEEAQGGEDTRRLVVAEVGRQHVLDLLLVVEEEDHGEEPDRVALVRVGDDLGDRDEAPPAARDHGPEGGRGEQRDDQPAWAGKLVRTHRSPKRPRTWKGAGTRPVGWSRRRCGSLTKARRSPARQRRSNAARARNISRAWPAR